MDSLKKELIKVINRIPKDLIVWEKEIKKINDKKDRNSKDMRKGFEYSRDHSYYLGKLVAYVYVLGKLDKNAEINSSVHNYFKKRIK